MYLFYDRLIAQNKVELKQQIHSKVKFDDIIGIEEFKEELENIVIQLKNRKQFIKSGAKIPKGILLVGPPGCGKTQLARAVSGETNLPFYQYTASDFVQPLYGKGEKLIEKIFQQARKSKKGAIIFIDEIDSLGSRNQFFTNMNSIVNQLLSEMDGFVGSENILVIGATNREDALDKALTRTGRFDLKIRIRLPTLKSRQKLIDYFLNKIKFEENLNTLQLAQKTIGFSPAEIKNLINTSMILAIKKNKTQAEEEDFSQAFDKIKLGIKGELVNDESILNEIALKEATKAVFAETHKELPKVDKISIFQYGTDSFGKSIFLQNTDMTNYNKKELLLQIQLFLSTAISQQKMGNRTSSIVKQDIKRGYQLVNRYVTLLGMEEQFSLLSLDKKYFSEQYKYEIEQKCLQILEEQYKLTEKKVTNLQPAITRVQQKLREKEELLRSEILPLIQN